MPNLLMFFKPYLWSGGSLVVKFLFGFLKSALKYIKYPVLMLYLPKKYQFRNKTTTQF